MCINGFVLIVETSTGTNRSSPFDFDRYCHNAADQPIGNTNATTGIFVPTFDTELSCNAAASTYTWHIANFDMTDSADATLGVLASDGSYVTSLTNSTTNPLQLLAGEIMIWDAIWGFINILTAGSLFTVLASLGIPAVFTTVMQGIMGIYLALTIISIKWQF